MTSPHRVNSPQTRGSIAGNTLAHDLLEDGKEFFASHAAALTLPVKTALRLIVVVAALTGGIAAVSAALVVAMLYALTQTLGALGLSQVTVGWAAVGGCLAAFAMLVLAIRVTLGKISHSAGQFATAVRDLGSAVEEISSMLRGVKDALRSEKTDAEK